MRNSFSFTLINTPEIRSVRHIFVTHHHKAELKFQRKKFRHFWLNYMENPHEDGPRWGKRERLCLFVCCRFFRANCVFRFFFRPLRVPIHHTESICPNEQIYRLINWLDVCFRMITNDRFVSKNIFRLIVKFICIL